MSDTTGAIERSGSTSTFRMVCIIPIVDEQVIG